MTIIFDDNDIDMKTDQKNHSPQKMENFVIATCEVHVRGFQRAFEKLISYTKHHLTHTRQFNSPLTHPNLSRELLSSGYGDNHEYDDDKSFFSVF
jgi:hypothetical protein